MVAHIQVCAAGNPAIGQKPVVPCIWVEGGIAVDVRFIEHFSLRGNQAAYFPHPTVIGPALGPVTVISAKRCRLYVSCAECQAEQHCQYGRPMAHPGFFLNGFVPVYFLPFSFPFVCFISHDLLPVPFLSFYLIPFYFLSFYLILFYFLFPHSFSLPFFPFCFFTLRPIFLLNPYYIFLLFFPLCFPILRLSSLPYAIPFPVISHTYLIASIPHTYRTASISSYISHRFCSLYKSPCSCSSYNLSFLNPSSPLSLRFLSEIFFLGFSASPFAPIPG